MKLRFFSTLSALLTIGAILPTQSLASTSTMYGTPMQEQKSPNFVQKSNGALTHIRPDQGAKKVKTTTSVDTSSMEENLMNSVSHNPLENIDDIIDCNETDQLVLDSEFDNEQRGWIGDIHFVDIYNVALRMEEAEQLAN